MQKLYRASAQFSKMPSNKAYNLTISHEKKFIWFRVAKVGTRTIFHHFKENDIPLDVSRSSDLHYPVNHYKDYFKFAFVRNPWERLVSCWKDKVVKNNMYKFDELEYERLQKFENFVDYVTTIDVDTCDRHLRTQSSLIDLNHIDFIGRMETFDADLNEVLGTLGLTITDAAPRNVSPNKQPYQDFYNWSLVDRVARIYRRDVQIFGYHF